jgi:hypothetical protein
MSYKTILAILDTADNCAAVAEFAFAIAAENNAHVIGFMLRRSRSCRLSRRWRSPIRSPYRHCRIWRTPRRSRSSGSCAARQRLEGASFEWRSFTSSAGYGSATLIESARSADLLIASQADPAKPSDSHVDVDSFLLDSGRPVLMIPFIIREPKPIKRVLIAWNGSKEAARATFDATAVSEGG